MPTVIHLCYVKLHCRSKNVMLLLVLFGTENNISDGFVLQKFSRQKNYSCFWVYKPLIYLSLFLEHNSINVPGLFYSQAFTDEDTHHTGTISGPALHEILNEHAFRMSSDQFSYIWSKLPKNAEGKVDYRDFLKIFSTRTDVVRVASTTPPQSRDRRVSSPLSNFYKLVSAEKIPFPTRVEPQRLFQFSILIHIDKFALIRSGLALILRIKNSILFHLHYQGKFFLKKPA